MNLTVVMPLVVRSLVSWLASLLCLFTPYGYWSGWNLMSSASLSANVRDFLEENRDNFKKKFDPAHPKSKNGEGKDMKFLVQDICINGLSTFNMEKLELCTDSDSIRVNVHVSWPEIVGEAKASVKKWVKTLFIRQRFSTRGHFQVSLTQLSVSLSTTLTLSMVDWEPTLKPSETSIQVSFSGIQVKPRLSGAIGKILGQAKKPTNHVASKFANKFWRDNNAKLHEKMQLKFNKVIEDRLSRKLRDALPGFIK